MLGSCSSEPGVRYNLQHKNIKLKLSIKEATSTWTCWQLLLLVVTDVFKKVLLQLPRWGMAAFAYLSLHNFSTRASVQVLFCLTGRTAAEEITNSPRGQDTVECFEHLSKP